jgi:hypothetical protein
MASDYNHNLKLNPETQEKIVSAIKAGNYVKVAASYGGINEDTHYSWMKKGLADPESVYGGYRAAVLAADAHSEVRAVAIIQAAMPENWAAAMTFLERRWPDRWGRRAGFEVKYQRMDDDDLIRETAVLFARDAGTGAESAGPEPEPHPLSE